MILKGVLHPDDALKAKQIGCDSIYVSKDGAGQFDGGVSPLNQLIKIRQTVGPEYPLIYDSGIRSGLDIERNLFRRRFSFCWKTIYVRSWVFSRIGCSTSHSIY